jgi:hypothetical protein
MRSVIVLLKRIQVSTHIITERFVFFVLSQLQEMVEMYEDMEEVIPEDILCKIVIFPLMIF